MKTKRELKEAYKQMKIAMGSLQLIRKIGLVGVVAIEI